MTARARKVVETLCEEGDCYDDRDTHWHVFSGELLETLPVGEYTLTVRVRRARKRRIPR